MIGSAGTSVKNFFQELAVERDSFKRQTPSLVVVIIPYAGVALAAHIHP
jgi:hypothetical protein